MVLEALNSKWQTCIEHQYHCQKKGTIIILDMGEDLKCQKMYLLHMSIFIVGGDFY